MDRAGAALRHATTELRAVQASALADRPEDRHGGIGIERDVLAVEDKRCGHGTSPLPLCLHNPAKILNNAANPASWPGRENPTGLINHQHRHDGFALDALKVTVADGEPCRFP